MLEHHHLPNFEQTALPYLDAANNLVRCLTRNKQVPEGDASSGATAKRGRRNESGVMRLAFRPSMVSKLRFNSLVLAFSFRLLCRPPGRRMALWVSRHTKWQPM